MSELFVPNKVQHSYTSLEEAFPDADPGVSEVFGNRILFQLRMPKAESAGGLLLPDEVKETLRWNEQVAKVVKVGPIAFQNPNTGEPWREGAWLKEGDYVRIPKHGGDKWSVKITLENRFGHSVTEEIMFAVFDHHAPIGKVDNPLTMKSYL